MTTALKGTVLGLLVAVTFAGILASKVSSSKGKEETSQTTISSPKNTSEDPVLTFDVRTVTSLTIDPSQAIYFDAEVTGDSVDMAIAALETMSKTHDDIYVFINSPGGSVFDGIRLTTYIENSNKNINTVCVSLCASMAAHLHQSGKKRYMLGSGVLMFHPASGGLRGQVENMDSQLKMIKTLVDRLDAKITTRSGINYKDFKNKVAFEYWVLADDAVKENLSEGIINVSTGDATKPFGLSLSKAAKEAGKNIRLDYQYPEKKIVPPVIVM